MGNQRRKSNWKWKKWFAFRAKSKTAHGSLQPSVDSDQVLDDAKEPLVQPTATSEITADTTVQPIWSSDAPSPPPRRCYKKYKFATYEVAKGYIAIFPRVKGAHWCEFHECWHVTKKPGLAAHSPLTELIGTPQWDLIESVDSEFSHYYRAKRAR